MQRVTVNLPEKHKCFECGSPLQGPYCQKCNPDIKNVDLETIAANFERRAKDLLENYQNTHKQKNRERYDKVLVAYTTWRDAARSLRLVAEGRVTLEQLRKATER